MNGLARWLARSWLQTQVSVAVLLGRKRRSIELMQDVLCLDPDRAATRNALANLLFETGDAAGAVEQFVRLLERWPDDADAWFNLGFIHESRDDLANAERCFRRALELNPKIDRAWYGLGLTLIRVGRLTEAIDAFRKNIALQPFSPYGFYQLAMTYHHLGRDGEAMQVHAELAKFEPKYAATLKRDIERSPPAAAGGPRPVDTVAHKEAIAITV